MENTSIVEYKPFYIVTHKDGRTREVSEDLGKSLWMERASKNKQCVLCIWDEYIDWFSIVEIAKHKPSSDIDSYILSQPKHIRDKLKKISISFNSIQHVSNYIEAINRWEL
jgi:hypothetical protein